jgi:hypothetical protein
MGGQSAQGTILARSIDPNWPDSSPQGGSVTFTDVAELRDLTPPALQRNTIETTTHNETWDKKVVGIKRHGDLSADLNFEPSNATQDHLTGLQKSYDDGARDIWRITYPNTEKWLFSGYITGFEVDAPVDDRLAADLTVAVTGQHEWQAAS